jgi:hypothetical protein
MAQETTPYNTQALTADGGNTILLSTLELLSPTIPVPLLAQEEKE